ncbi:protein-glutamine gamma-glutamyltransferase E isoform X2 [Scophthalmus maximus]|uniref:protein-glutamine gamma-glutamyltransferase E isoform X2 n=1 Tax=Scophthalmus maximus TaxID=52904 RepID=UPI001FA8E311|nr:protein-glutamine gamma-glutamyltransferase E isoform X2 [Scophthalmus maximus]
MTDELVKESIFQGVELHTETNNTEHHTSEISVTELIVRRGQPFTVTLRLRQPFNPDRHPLTVMAMAGPEPREDFGTMSYFGIPPSVRPSAKASWKLELHKNSAPHTGVLPLIITPPADAPIGEYILTASHRDEDTLLARLVVLFNTWCPEDGVFLPDEAERQEYVMSEQGIIYKGSGNYINSLSWDFGQFEDDMVKICMTILNVSNNHLDNPAEDVSARADPTYVGRVVSAMINSQDDHGVVYGKWGGSYVGGRSPSHWSGSHAILKHWLNINCHPVKFGQCWVFAGVMCSVMRLFGIPCRVVTNYSSAHDTNSNLTIDVYHADYGVRERESPDSVWNFHVWVEGWMKRPDLAVDGKFDGWQVLDPTPQEMSNGIFCCGPASVKAIQSGDVNLKYDVPFVFAEVNADCVDWLVKADGSKLKIFSDTKKVGQNISTKSVGSKKRRNITDNYKHREGSEKERNVFKYALTRDFTIDEEEEENEVEEENEEAMETSDGTGAATGENEEATGTSGGAVAATGTSGGAVAATGTSGGAVAATGTSGGAGATTGTSGGAGAATGTSAGAGAATGTVTGTSAGATTGTSRGAGAATGTSAGAGAATGTSRGAGAATGNSGGAGAATPDNIPLLPVSLRFREVSKPLNGKDVKLDLVLRSESRVARPLSINISVQAMRYNGSAVAHIQTEVKEEILQPGKGLSIPVLVLFSAYHKHMVQCDSVKVSAVVTDKENPDDVYLAESDVVLLDPPLSIIVSGPVRLNHETSVELIFKNPANETLTDCELTVSGSGLLRDETPWKLPELQPKKQFRIKVFFVPYKKGEKTLMAVIDCSTFRDIKATYTVTVAP